MPAIQKELKWSVRLVLIPCASVLSAPSLIHTTHIMHPGVTAGMMSVPQQPLPEARTFLQQSNLLTFPGLTDLPEEAEALVKFIREYDVNMVQFRNLNIDPELLGSRVSLADREVLGINGLIVLLQDKVPGLLIGNYSRPVKR